MNTYQALLIVHVYAVIGLAGPIMLVPRWLNLMHSDTGRSALHKLHLQTGIAGWTVLISGLFLLYLQHWNWLQATWMQLSIALYVGAQAIDHVWADRQEHRIENGAETSTATLQTWLIIKLFIFLSIVILMMSKPQIFQ